MEIKTHDNDDLQVKHDVKVEGNLRKQENKTVTKFQDGSIEEVHETLEEVVPMRTTQRVVRKIAMVPTEERVETFGPDGSVQTNVKTLNGPVEVTSNNTSLKDVVDQLKDLGEKLDGLTAAPVVAQSVAKTPFLAMAKNKYADIVTSVDMPNTAAVDPVVVSASKTEKVVAVVLWVVFVAVASYLAYRLI